MATSPYRGKRQAQAEEPQLVTRQALTIQQVMVWLGYKSRNPIYDMIARGELESGKFGYWRRISIESVERYLAQNLPRIA